MSLGRKKARGRQGSWFAEVEGELYPCVHQHWVTGTKYHDPMPTKDTNKKYPDYLEAIAKIKVVIITKDKVPEWIRQGYVCLYSIDNVVVSSAGLTFDLKQRLEELY